MSGKSIETSMTTSSTHPEVEIVYEEPELLDESKHYSNSELVRELNRLRAEINHLRK